jgi:predicted alpha/beta-hydrolase family hydrolase
MLAAEDPAIVDALLLLSYPLHPPKKPEQLRINHLPQLRVPALFIHGSRDPFGSIDEMIKHTALIPSRHELEAVEGAGHDLLGRKASGPLIERITSRFLRFTSGAIE